MDDVRPDRADVVRPRERPMSSLLVFAIVIVVYLALQLYVLPKLGVPT